MLCEYFEFCYSFLNVAVVGEYRERDIERYRARVSSNGEEYQVSSMIDLGI